MHLMAWKHGLKSLYYCRSKSIQRAEDVSVAGVVNEGTVKFSPLPLPGAEGEPLPIAAMNTEDGDEATDYEECLACQ
jgi:ribonucleoside-diphosphate reductase alpha chain